MRATELVGRLRSARARLTVAVIAALMIVDFPAAAQQLGNNFTLDDQQTAVAHVDQGQFVRVRLRDGARAGGPLVRATPLTFVVGPSVAFGDQDRALALQEVDSMWVRVYSTRRGMLLGGALGGLAGLGIGTSAGSLCPVDGYAKPCVQGAVTSVVTGALLGGIAGSLVGGGRLHWRRLLPRAGEPPVVPDISRATLTVPDDSAAFDRRALVLMRIPRGNLVRLTFGDRGDLSGYLVSAGAHGATLGVVAGHPGDAPIPMTSLEGVWERGDASRAVASLGLLLGSVAGVIVATQSSACDPHSHCARTIAADGVGLGLIGLFGGHLAGRLMPQWRRRYSN